jgi:nucleotide-binding universal stress UspA family protein
MTTCHDSYDRIGQHQDPNPDPIPPRIVVGVDGSPNSIAALRQAGGIARREGARLDVVFVYSASPSLDVRLGTSASSPYGFPETGDPDVTAIADQDQADAQRVLAQCIEEAFGDAPPARLESLAVIGSPRRVLSALSHGALLLVVGARGHSGALGLLIGSTAQACTKTAACPVLVVPAEVPAQAAGGPSRSPSVGRSH